MTLTFKCQTLDSATSSDSDSFYAIMTLYKSVLDYVSLDAVISKPLFSGKTGKSLR